MRALEITIWASLIIASMAVLQGIGVVHIASNTCTTADCQARAFLYNMANMTSLQEVSLDTTNYSSMAITAVTLGLNYVVFSIFWLLYILALFVLLGPALQIMFGVPVVIAEFLMIGVWFLWLLAIIQIKRGGLGVDSWR